MVSELETCLIHNFKAGIDDKHPTVCTIGNLKPSKLYEIKQIMAH